VAGEAAGADARVAEVAAQSEPLVQGAGDRDETATAAEVAGAPEGVAWLSAQERRCMRLAERPCCCGFAEALWWSLLVVVVVLRVAQLLSLAAAASSSSMWSSWQENRGRVDGGSEGEAKTDRGTSERKHDTTPTHHAPANSQQWGTILLLVE